MAVGRFGPFPKPVIAPPWVFVPHPLMTHMWLRCDLSVIEVACPYEGCGAGIGDPCFFPASEHRGGRMTKEGMAPTLHKQPAQYKGGEGHSARRKAAAVHRQGRSKIGVPVALEVDMDSGNVNVTVLVPNLARDEEEREENCAGHGEADSD